MSTGQQPPQPDRQLFPSCKHSRRIDVSTGMERRPGKPELVAMDHRVETAAFKFTFDGLTEHVPYRPGAVIDEPTFAVGGEIQPPTAESTIKD